MVVYKFLLEAGINIYFTDAFVDTNTNKVLNNFTVTESRESSKDIISTGVNIQTGIMYTENDFIEMAKTGKVALVRANDELSEEILFAPTREGVTVTLTAPTNSATDVAKDFVKFTWGKVEGISYYALTVKETSSARQITINIAQMNAPESSLSGLVGSTNYSWSVSAIFPDMSIATSETFTFTTAA